MIARLRDLLRIEPVRRAVRDKTQRAVGEVVEPLHDEHAERLERLEREVAELRAKDLPELRELLSGQQRELLDRLVEFEVRTRRDIVYASDVDTTRDTGRFVAEQMPGARRFAHPHETLRYALSLAPQGGMALEFGVYRGETLRVIAGERTGAVYGFDSFQGLPEDWRLDFPAGTFDVDGLPSVDGAELVVGWFAETLPGFLDAHQAPVDFLHVDGDLYSSARTVLDLVGPRLRPGSVVVFDEFFNFPGWRDHEYRAWQEYVARTGTRFGYEAYTYSDEQVVVRITAE
ncbi:hypothetical protein CFN78_10295 [Amycolatopsis antarctica]|uniref:Methyltransferase n=1 Tax=Amycolatopsis antarctica TaxID=1854586 RepID=A0A263D6Z0_9PSEU|nr:class I SAM-dependent methyltransferase [Amycolatopsis antarctica]OZM73246.1 hypothetical protein CFN78_10295 [Amycolatopsis antarctica]